MATRSRSATARSTRSRAARAALEAAGAALTYRESPLPHTIDPGFLPGLRAFVASALGL